MGKKNPYLKTANQEQEYTYDQIQELRKCKKDPVYFIKKYVRIVHGKHGTVPFELYPFQEDMVRAFHKQQYTIVLSARQTGKALFIDTPIPTPDGWTTMGDLAVGDTILDANGKPTKVTFVTETMTNHKCYSVNFSNGENIIADANHLWEVNDTFLKKKKVLTTQEMVDIGNGPRPDDKTCRYSVNTTKALELEKQDLKIDPYVLGTWLGDGTSAKGECTVENKDLVIYKTHKSIYEEFDIRPQKSKPHILRICMRKLRGQLKEIGVLNNKHIPMKYLRSCKEDRIALLQGLMDTDGTIDKTRGGCELTLSNDRLAYDAYELICSLGLKPTLIPKLKSGFKTNCIIFTPYRDDFDVFRLKRKLNRQKQSPHHTRKLSTKRRSILSITPVDSVPVKCITVDSDDHLFLAGRNMIPTHNSTVSAAFLLWYGIFNFDKTVLIASRANDHAMEMIERIRFAYEHLPMWLKPGVRDDGWNKHMLGFDNNSRIMSTATSENSGRGYTISLLYLDEFAFVAPNIQELFWTSIQPTLATGGSCIMTSTPNGDMDIFSKIWRGANLPSSDPNKVSHNNFKAIEVKWTEPPNRDEAFKEDQIAKLGERKWMQEYECVFLSSDALLIDSLFLANQTPIMEKIRPLSVVNDVAFFKPVSVGATYLIGVDPSTGSGEDYSVITVFDFPSLGQVAEYRNNTMSTSKLYEVLKNLLLYLEKYQCLVYFSIENNGVGEGVIALYEADENPPETCEMVSETGKDKRGFNTTARSKMKACVNLKEMYEKGNMQVMSNVLFSELKAYIRNKGAYAAQPGSTDDCVSAVLIVIRLLEEISSYDQEAFDKLYTGGFEKWDEESWDGYSGEYDDNDEGLPILI